MEGIAADATCHGQRPTDKPHVREVQNDFRCPEECSWLLT